MRPLMTGTYKCRCHDGFKSDSVDEKAVCVNINECVELSDACPEGSNCVDNEGGYSCLCPEGHSQLSSVCGDYDECAAFQLSRVSHEFYFFPIVFL